MRLSCPDVTRWGLLSLALVLVSPLSVHATTVVPPEFSTMAAQADFVVRGRVVALHPEVRVNGNSRRIFTAVEVEVLEVIAGTPPDQLVLECLGGRVGDEEMVVDGAPSFAVGQESILFVKGNGHTLCPLYAMSYGFYPVQEDAATKRRYVARGNYAPLGSVAQVSQPLHDSDGDVSAVTKFTPAQALSPDEFVREIKLVARSGHPKAGN